jgi:hypothetical protein
MLKTLLRLGVALGTVAATLALGAAPASAHERRVVGSYLLVVGWGDEPPVAGVPNSVQVIISDRSGARPVVDLGDTLQVEVIFGSQTSERMTLEAAFAVNPDGTARFGRLGDYRAELAPTRPGTYTFHVVGTIKGEQVDERFTCGEQTFECPKALADMSFPAKDPTTADLARRLDRTALRLADRADQARTLAFVGIGIGALGVLVGLARGRRKRAAA